MLYAFFCVIPRRLNFICQCFGTLCFFHLHRQVVMKMSSYLHAYEDGTECSETLAYKFRRREITQKKAYNNFKFICINTLSLRTNIFKECGKISASYSQWVRRSNRQMHILITNYGFINSRKSTVLHLVHICHFKSSNTAKMC